MTRMVLISAAASVVNDTFFRLGRAWTKEGVVVDMDDFSPEDQAILVNEKMLHIGPAPDDAEVEVQVNLTVAEAVKAAIPTLRADAFDENGAPKVEALKEALPEMAKKITAKLVAGVWADLNPPK